MDELRSRIVAMTKAGVFGPPGTWPYVRDNNGERSLGLNFASEIEFFRIGLDRTGRHQPEECEYEEIYVAVKTQLKGEKERRFTNNETMFFNEVYMYQTIVPLIGAEERGMFAKCFYAEACPGNPSRDMVITEDLSLRGYFETGELILDDRSLKATLTKLGEFHGLSYKAKKNCPSFESKVKELKPIKFDDEFDTLLLATANRGISPCLSRVNDEHKQTLNQLVRILSSGRAVLRHLKTPEEPFAVVCHGEFHKSNLLFKRDKDGVDVVFLDLQMSLYSDPSTDLSFLLHMNTTHDTRQNRWDELIAYYWNGILSVEPQPGFTFMDFKLNLEKKSIYGYLPTSIFLPLMMNHLDANESIEDFLGHSLEERISMMEEIGGEEATEVLSGIVLDLLERGHIQNFLAHIAPTNP